MSEAHVWNHMQCTACWLCRWGLTRTPARVKDTQFGQCCFCGAETASGIFIRVKLGDPSIPYCPAFSGAIYGDSETSRPRIQSPSTDAQGSGAPSSPP